MLVYKAVLESGVYIGSTTRQKLSTRIAEHKYQKRIAGIENAVFSVLYETDNKEDLLLKERFYINQFGTLNQKDPITEKCFKKRVGVKGRKCPWFHKKIIVNEALVFLSITEACKTLKLRMPKVSSCLVGRSKTHKSMTFRYFNGGV